MSDWRSWMPAREFLWARFAGTRRRGGASLLPRTVELSPRAERQLAQIEDHYLREAGPSVANEVVFTLLDAMERLGALPETCRPASLLLVRCAGAQARKSSP